MSPEWTFDRGTGGGRHPQSAATQQDHAPQRPDGEDRDSHCLLPAAPWLAHFRDDLTMCPNGGCKDQVPPGHFFPGAMAMAQALYGLKRVHREPGFL